MTLAERAADFSGRLRWETALPGLRTWDRVVIYRLGQLRKMANVALYRGSDLTAPDVFGLDADHVVIATGGRWLTALYGANELPSGQATGPRIYTPDDLAAGVVPEGPVAVFDFDN